MDLALSEGRLSRWEELLDELQPRQLAVLQAYQRIRPFGEQRADLREAVMATSVAVAISAKRVSPDKALKHIEGLAGYLGEEEETVSPNAMAAQMRQAFPSRSR